MIDRHNGVALIVRVRLVEASTDQAEGPEDTSFQVEA